MRPPLLFVLALGMSLSSMPARAQGPVSRSLTAAAEHLARAVPPPAAPRRASRGVDLRWDELGPVVSGRMVTVFLSDGARVRGEALVVRDDALVVDVHGTSGAPAYSGTGAVIPRANVQAIDVRKPGASSGRMLGTVIGVLTGLVVGGYVTGQVADSAGVGIPVFLAMASGITVAGYHAGKQLDTRVTTIRVLR